MQFTIKIPKLDSGPLKAVIGFWVAFAILIWSVATWGNIIGPILQHLLAWGIVFGLIAVVSWIVWMVAEAWIKSAAHAREQKAYAEKKAKEAEAAYAHDRR